MIRTFFSRLRRHAAFTLALLIFVSAIVGALTYTIQRLRSETIDTHLESASVYAHVLEDQLTQNFRLAHFVLAQSLDAKLIAAMPEQAAAELKKILHHTPLLRSLSLIDEHSRIVASSNPANVGKTLPDDNFFPPRNKMSDSFAIGGFWSGRDFSNGIPSLLEKRNRPAASPEFIPVVYDLRIGKQHWGLVAAINPDYLINNFTQKLPPERGFADVFRDDGRLLFSSREEEQRLFSTPLTTERLNENGSGYFEETLADSTAVLTAYRASSQYPLHVVTRLYRKPALSRWEAEKNLLLSISIPSLLLVTLLSALLYRRERRQASARIEARQREHERLAATVFATVDDAVMVTDAERRIIEVNPAFTTITGFSSAEVIGQLPSILSSGKHPADFFRLMNVSLVENGSWRGEICNLHKNGSLYIAWLAIKQVRNEQGEVSHYVAAFSDITDRKLAEETQLHTILEASPEAVLLVDADGNVCFANRVAERVFGYSHTELIGLSVETLIPPELREAHRKSRQNFSGHPQSRPMASGLRLAAQRRDGSQFPAEISLSPIRMGDQPMVIASVSDISQRIRNEQTLLASEERWKFALEGAGEGVWDWDIAANTALFSRKMYELWGRADRDDLHFTTLTGKIHPDDRDTFTQHLEAHLGGETPSLANEHRFLDNLGQWRWAHCRGMVVSRDDQGRPLRMIGTYADISERKKIESDFRDLLQFNQAIIANSDFGIMVHQENGECIMANEAAARISGGSHHELLQHDFRHSRSWQEAKATAAADQALRSGKAVAFEAPMRTFFDREIWCVASFCRISLKGQNYLLSVFNDISRRKQAENALREAKENAEALLDRARMAERRIVDISEETRMKIGLELHDDLGQHLTGVAFLSEVLFQKLKQLESPESPAAATITELINEAVAKTRLLAQGLYPVELKEAGLIPLLRQAARNVESIYRIRCTFTATDLPEIHDEHTQINLFRIAQEAINNAIRHGNASEIKLQLTQDNTYLLFEIADNGSGFDCPEPGSRTTPGQGLGLRTMHYRADLIGATLQISSTPQTGTRLLLQLPLEEEHRRHAHR